jgi:acetyl esterase/lipase
MYLSGSWDKTMRVLPPRRHPYGAENSQFGDLYLPTSAGPYPVVILLHGGFWRASYGLKLMRKLARDLAQRGAAVWNVEYRRVGNAGGGWPGTLQDVAHAADFLRRIAPDSALDLNRVITVGHSAGAQLALWLAARARLPPQSQLSVSKTPLRLAGAVSLAGASDLKLVWHHDLGQGAASAFLGGSPGRFPERYSLASPAALLPLGIPQVLVHGARDSLVPLTISQYYARQAALAGDHVKLIELAGADHFTLIDSTTAAWSRIIEEIQQLLR